MTVKFLVSCGRSQAEVCAQINDAFARSQQRTRVFRRDTVRQGEKIGVNAGVGGEGGGFAGREGQVGRYRAAQTRQDFGHGLARERARSHAHQLGARMPGEKLYQLLTRITGSSDNADIHGKKEVRGLK